MKRSGGKADNKPTAKRTLKQNLENPNSKSKSNPSSSGSATTSSEAKFLANTKIFILQAGIGKARCDIFKKQLQLNGGELCNEISNHVTHLIVDEKMELDRMCRLLKIETPPENVVIVKSLWLSKCIKEKQKVDTVDYELNMSKCKFPEKTEYKTSPDQEKRTEHKTSPDQEKHLMEARGKINPTPSTSAVHDENDNEERKKHAKVGIMYSTYNKVKMAESSDSDAGSDYVASGDERDVEVHGDEDLDELTAAAAFKKSQLKGKWVCAVPSSQQPINYNKHITDKLEALAKIYENTNDRWRALGYQKAISALKRQPKAITSFEEARALPGVGEKLANKVWEIIESGALRKLEEISSSEEVKTINMFTNIWGAGAMTARHWWAQGFRTLEDLRTKASLTKHQKIGLQYYDELLERMSREEAGQIEQTVKDAVLSIRPGMVCMACGSYRRGKGTCGDVDVLVTHPDGKSHLGMFQKILRRLHDTGFLTDDLVIQEDNGNQQKYLGVCKLPGEHTKHRRLDIIVVPYDEYACALMYFTGSAHFNRSMRNLAGKMGMSLSEHSLNVGVVRMRGEKLNKGTPLPTPTEESVFRHLGLEYRKPEERDH